MRPCTPNPYWVVIERHYLKSHLPKEHPKEVHVEIEVTGGIKAKCDAITCELCLFVDLVVI